MSADGASIDGNSPAKPPSTPGGKIKFLTLEDLDRRTRAARATEQMLGSLIDDLGGSKQVTTAERELCMRAAIMSAMLADAECRWLSGERIALSEYLPTVNAHRRALLALGLERRQRNARHDLDAYLAKDQAA